LCLQQACTDNSHTIDGSSTVYPLTREAAEFFEKSGDGIVSLAYSGTVTGTIFNVPSIADAWLDLLLTQ
jgi:ABC-type phosphate transport system substrate-binding protein